MLPGVLGLIQEGGDLEATLLNTGPRMNNGTSDLTDSIMSSARMFQTQASGSRLAKAPIAYARSGLTGIRTRNLDIAAQIKEFTKIEFFDLNVSAKAAFDKLLISLRSNFEVKNPTAQQLTWSNVSLFAHENQNRFSSLQNCDLATSLGQFFKAEFIRKKIRTKRKLDNREIEIRLMYERVKVFSESDSEAPQSEDDSLEFLGSKRKRSVTQASAYTSKRLQPPSLTSKAASSSRPAFLKSSYKARSDEAIILKSAYRLRAPQAQWSKDVDTTSCQFFRISATYDIKTCQVELSPEATDVEDIEIATKWENKKDGGYVGIGYTKRGIYARFAGREYVITQPFEGTAENVRHVLEEEYKLLCQCHGFKGAFDDFAKDRKMQTIPNFYFNFPSSILGKLVPSLSSGSRKLPYQYFIATPLLPYGDADPKIKKFTGNGEIGIPQDDITKAMHAFAHFSVVYSHSNLLFCDLQGAPDIQQIMCLIDPQCHTSTNPKDTVYWDGGLEKIEAFIHEHNIVCEDNWVCRGLKLKDVVVEHSTSKSPTKSPQLNKKSRLSYITHEDGNI
ncbi:kinase-like domain-containing protein [Pholiota molesta]|nr:kinase-like domain-containing protein [Pholiota molesta]